MKLETFVERLKTYDLQQDNTKILEDLRELATNRTLLSNPLYNTIQQEGFSTRNRLYNAYAFVLHCTDLFTVRLGFWSPVTTHDESETFIYNLNHTHDFELYAVGYSGDGYTTVIREILDDLPLQAGKTPTLGDERTLKLAPGETLYIPALLQVHKQLAPPQPMSASLSVLMHPQRSVKNDEAWRFDENYTPTHPGIAMQETAFFTDTMKAFLPGRRPSRSAAFFQSGLKIRLCTFVIIF